MNENELYAHVPETKQLIYICEGTGDNLTKEDLAEGYVDYLNYSTYDLESGINEADSGMLLLRQPASEKYPNFSDCLSDILDDLYDNPNMKTMLLPSV